MANVAPTRKLFKQFHMGGTEDLDVWRETFVAALDPTEYEGAVALGMSWQEWQGFKRAWPHFVSSILPEWLDEIDIRLKSNAIRRVVKNAESSAQDAVSSAKWLAEGRYKPKQAGRPSKEEVVRQAKVAAGVAEETDDEVNRVLGTIN